MPLQKAQVINSAELNISNVNSTLNLHYLSLIQHKNYLLTSITVFSQPLLSYWAQ
jgi:hypothetical protein